MFKTSQFKEDALRKVIVLGLKSVDIIARSYGKVIDIAREHKEGDVVPDPLLETVCGGGKEA